MGQYDSAVTKPAPSTNAANAANAATPAPIAPEPMRVPGAPAAARLTDTTARAISLMGHELANQLMAIRGYAELVSHDPGLPEPVRGDMARILEQVGRAGQATIAINALVRPQRLNLEPVAVLRLIESIRAAQTELAGSAIEWSIIVEPNLPPVMADPHELREVLLALTAMSINAIRADRPTGHLDIQADEQVNDSGVAIIVITIADDGPPLPMAGLADLLSPLAAGGPEGLADGLAFAVAEDRVRRQQGLLLDRIAEGDRGARFQVELRAGSEPG